MASLALGVRFVPASGGTGSFVYASTVVGYRGDTALTNGKTYPYRAESSDLSQWEFGYGVWSGGTTLTRVVSFSSTGGTVNFTNPPQIAINIRPEDVLQFDDAMSLTDAQQAMGRSNISAILKGHMFGLTLSNNGTDATNDIDIAVGECASDASTPLLMVLGSALTKRLDAGWAAGTNQGMRNSGAAITDTTYHLYLVSQANGANVDVYAHTSTVISTVLTALQAESGGGSYTHARRIGSIIRASGAIKGFTQRGNVFLLKVPEVQSTSALGTSATLFTLPVPTGIQVDAICHFLGGKANAQPSILITSPDQTDTAPGPYTFYGNLDTTTAWLGYASKEVRTDTSGQIRARADTTSVTFSIACDGWIDAAIPTS